MPHPSCYLISIMDKIIMGLLLLFLSVQLQQVSSYLRQRYPCDQPFFTVMIDRYILAIQQIINIWHSFSSVVVFWTASEALKPWSKQQKVAKTTSKLPSLSNSSQKSSFFAVLMYALYGHPRISNSRENINNTARVSRLYFCFLWLCPSFHYLNQNYHHH